eukprot:scaffold57437_cov33-Tisochrysis_lutea.AAC.2
MARFSRVVGWHAEPPARVIGLCRACIVEAHEAEFRLRLRLLPLREPLLEGSVIDLHGKPSG